MDNVPHCIFWKHTQSGSPGRNENRAVHHGRTDPRGALDEAAPDAAQRAHADAFRRFERETMERGIPLLSQEEVRRDEQGRTLVILTSQVPFRNEAGEVIGLLGIVVDTSARKQVELGIERAKAAAERALRLESEFLANVRHELRTPLSLLCSPLASLLAGDSGALPGVVSSQIERAHRNALRLLGMVDDLLDLSRLELCLDTSSTIDGAGQARAFERFQQLHPAGARRYGMGLGLALVREFSELMGGSVDLQSEQGKGARILVRLPITTAVTTLPAALAPGALQGHSSSLSGWPWDVARSGAGAGEH